MNNKTFQRTAADDIQDTMDALQKNKYGDLRADDDVYATIDPVLEAENANILLADWPDEEDDG